jgi:hypothetical protein
MGYIIKGAAAAGGDATNAAQKQQIFQLTDSSGQPSVFKDLINDLSVFIDGNGESVFFKTGSQVSILQLVWTSITDLNIVLSKSTKVSGSTLCISFTAASPAALQILVQAFLVTIPLSSIVNMSYTNTGATNHFCYITYNP